MRRSILATILAGAIAAASCSGRSNPATTPTAPTTPVTSVPDGTWRGLTIAPEDRCSPYEADDYSYPQSVEDDIVRELGGIFSPYTCESFESDTETDIEHIIARSGGARFRSVQRRQRDPAGLRPRPADNLTLASPSSLNRSAEKRQGRGGVDAEPEPLLVRTDGRGRQVEVRTEHRSGRG